MSYFLLNVGHNYKTLKSDRFGHYLTSILYLSPANSSGHEICKSRSKGCTDVCLTFSGRGQQQSVQNGRLRKTALLFEDKKIFEWQLLDDLRSFERKCKREDKVPCFRPNGTSDIDWLTVMPSLYSQFQEQIYGYTKVRSRYQDWIDGKRPRNEYLTFSRSEHNEVACLDFLSQGGTCAALFRNGRFPKSYKGYPVVDGNIHDLRFTDPAGHWVGLKPSGRARKDKSGFVIDL